MALNRPHRPRLLSFTRPRRVKPKPTLSSKTTRSLIRTHHNLRKQLSSALAKRDENETKAINAEMRAYGGLQKYQEASLQGQSAQRGGDTSRVLMKWLSELGFSPANRNPKTLKPKMLEVGSLRLDNYCSRSGMFEMRRIDLHSQHLKIEEQDFMTMQLPATNNINNEGYDIVSLSLILNFVGDPAERGQMLGRVANFLRQVSPIDESMGKAFPLLFLVLPAPCVSNSRYMDEARLRSIMESLGYELLKTKLTPKLLFHLWRYQGPTGSDRKSFRKVELRSGNSRNNFAITIK